MRLGLNLGTWTGRTQDLELAEEADRLGYAVVWAAEAYGADAPTVLAFVAARTSRVDVGAAVMQIPARTPAMTAMTAATLDALSGGRFRLGLGVSGPQVSEGWHGVRFDAPLARTREYVAVVRSALRRETVEHAGRHVVLPLPGGPGKPLRLALTPVREHLPLYLAALGPQNLALAGELADGWLAVFFSPEHAAGLLEPLQEGRARAGRQDDPFDVVATAPLVVDDDLERAVEPVRPHAALYVGGMGSRELNVYNALARRMGYGAQAQRVQDLYLERRHRDAAAAVPAGFVDATSLLGGRDRLRDRMTAFAEAGVTTLAVQPFGRAHEERVAALRTAAEALDASGVAA